MPLPKPEPGRVLSYDYLWARQHEAGREDGDKARPAVIVLVSKELDGDALEVTVIPLTTRPQTNPALAVEIPQKVLSHIGLGSNSCWARIDEANVFTWPGPDLRPVPGRPEHFDYGLLPPKLFIKLRDAMLALRPVFKKRTD